MTPPLEPRLVLGLTAEAWAIGAGVVVVAIICLDSIAALLASVSAVRSSRIVVPVRRSSLPAFRAEALKAKRGGWRR